MNILRILKRMLNSFSDKELDELFLLTDNDFSVKEIQIGNDGIKLISEPNWEDKNE